MKALKIKCLFRHISYKANIYMFLSFCICWRYATFDYCVNINIFRQIAFVNVYYFFANGC